MIVPYLKTKLFLALVIAGFTHPAISVLFLFVLWARESVSNGALGTSFQDDHEFISSAIDSGYDLFEDDSSHLDDWMNSQGFIGSDTDWDSSSSIDIDSFSGMGSSIEINPGSGLPMLGGIGGVDVAGNAYGMDNSHDFLNDSFSGTDSFSSIDSGFDSAFDSSFDCGSTFDSDWDSGCSIGNDW